MKKIIYSAVTKAVAFLLAVACIVLCVNALVTGVEAYEKEELKIYDFETEFTDSNHFNWMLAEPINALASAVDAYWPNGKRTFAEIITEYLNTIQHGDKVDYLIVINGEKFTNCMELEKDYFENQRIYFSVQRKASGKIETEGKLKNGFVDVNYLFRQYNNTFSVYVSVDDDYVQQCETAWNNQADLAVKTAMQAFAFLGGAVLLIVFLCVIAGRNGKGELKESWFDRIWTEIHLALLGAAGVAVVIAVGEILWSLSNSDMTADLARLLSLSVAGVAGAIIVTCILSLVRKIKCGIFLKTSVIFIVLSWFFKILFRFLKWSGKKIKKSFLLVWKFTTGKSGALIILAILIYTIVIAIFGVMLTQDHLAVVAIILGVIAFGVLCYIFIKRANELEEIRSGASAVRNGDLTYKIPELKHEDLRTLAQDINDITSGLDRSVAKTLKAERMKTELITNVSHDLKTPLTSIINYTQLLSEIDNLPETAQDYVKIIAKKSERLKNLTQDLFDISKAQSGNEEIVSEKLDVALLINQSLGEHNNEITASGLEFCVTLAENLCIFADGRKMSRVMSNLIGNALKYAMKNTRVFVVACERNGEAVIEIKNTSAYPMNFDASEITSRFVRGDEARSTEGNGLGLAIASSYVELCGGEFEIIIDGDLFKAVIKFPEYK